MSVVGAPNPKDLVGARKVDLALMPPAGLIHGAHSLVDGARKYGPYNWREYKVQAMTYVSAAMRHLQAFVDGEEVALDSGCHHLGHVIGCCAILLDAQENDMLIDNRPPKGIASALLQRLNDQIARQSQAAKDRPAAGGSTAVDAICEAMSSGRQFPASY